MYLGHVLCSSFDFVKRDRYVTGKDIDVKKGLLAIKQQREVLKPRSSLAEFPHPIQEQRCPSHESPQRNRD
jgi:hypothetical protein